MDWFEHERRMLDHKGRELDHLLDWLDRHGEGHQLYEATIASAQALSAELTERLVKLLEMKKA